jgi:hypothetical protein
MMTFFINIAAATLYFLPLLTIVTQAKAAEFLIYKHTLTSISAGELPKECFGYSISLQGEIRPGDDDVFERLVDQTDKLRSEPGSCPYYNDLSLSLESPGGSMGVALRIATIIRYRSITTSVGAYRECMSACFYIWASTLGRERRTLDPTSVMGVHQSSIAGRVEPGSTLTGARLLRNWDIAPSVTDAMLGTPPNQMYILSRRQMGQIGLCFGCND